MENDFFKELGKYFIDISKLVFGGVVLSSILQIEGLSKVVVLVFGFIVTFSLAVLGFLIYRIKK